MALRPRRPVRPSGAGPSGGRGPRPMRAVRAVRAVRPSGARKGFVDLAQARELRSDVESHFFYSFFRADKKPSFFPSHGGKVKKYMPSIFVLPETEDCHRVRWGHKGNGGLEILLFGRA
ncbi:MAG: hypothetical protein EBZ77_09100 [Chitinophagia bacterium]|nr:hypothetical protein [Chitinophagia bacterium]